MIQERAALYGRPYPVHRCTYCHRPLPGRQTVSNPNCGSTICLQRADDAAADAAYKRMLDR